MPLKRSPSADGDEVAGSSWDTPSNEEFLRVAKRHGIVADDGPDDDAPATTGGEPATDDSDDDAPGGEDPDAGQETGAAKGEEAGEEGEAGAGEEEPVLEVDGKKYTAAEIRELEAGHLRNDHFTRVMQGVRAREREFVEELRAVRQERKELLELQKSLVGHAKADAGEGGEPETELDPAISRRLNTLNETINKITERLQQSEEQQQQRDQDAFIESTFNSTFDKLVERFKIPPNLHQALRALVIQDDPDTEDPATGRVSAEVIARSTERSVRHWLSQLQSQQKKQTAEAVDRLRKGSKALAPTKPKPQAGTPGKKKPAPLPPGRSPLLRRDRPRADWDSMEAIQEGMGRIADAQAED